MNNKFVKRALALAMVLLICFTTITGCGGNSSDAEADGSFTTITFWGATTQYDVDQYSEIVESYNNGQGKIDKVYVQYSPKGSDYSSNLTGVLSGKLAPTVCMIYDKYFKMYAAAGLLADLNPYVSDESTYTNDEDGNQNFDLSDLYDVNVYRYRYDSENNTSGADDSSLYALPNGCNPAMIYYNVDYFEAEGINIISVAEEDLDAYNSENGTSYMPHGYAEYTVDASPAEGLTTSTNLNGKTVVKVFNNRIAMNWTELVCLSRYFTPEYNSNASSYSSNLKYGFLSEWWFPYGWSVGGDCIQWDEDAGQYVFSLGDDKDNYLVTKDTTINGTAYSAGDVVSYNDAKKVTASDDSVYTLPSTLDAFTEFCKLYQSTSGKGEMKGYAISPDPTKISGGNETYFTSGNCALVMLSYSSTNTVKSNTSYDWDYAPAWQYREYEGGDVDGELSGSEGTMKVIGETYNGVVYTGALKEVNGTVVVGAKSSSSLNYSIAVAEQATEEEKEAAWKFIQYLAGEPGQSILATADNYVPNGISLCNSDTFLNSTLGQTKNLRAVVDASSYNTIMDQSYLENQAWINYWADILNTDVRGGSMSLTDFFSTVTDRVNSDLSGYTVRMIRR